MSAVGRAVALAAGVAAGLWASVGAADTTPLWHAAYGLGASVGAAPGLRQNLDLAAGVGFLARSGRGLVEGLDGPLLGGALVTGLRAYPSYVAVEGGWTSIHLVGYSVTAGPALRIDPVARVGGELAFSMMVAYVRLGARVIAVSDGDVQGCVTLGAGIE